MFVCLFVFMFKYEEPLKPQYQVQAIQATTQGVNKIWAHLGCIEDVWIVVSLRLQLSKGQESCWGWSMYNSVRFFELNFLWRHLCSCINEVKILMETLRRCQNIVIGHLLRRAVGTELFWGDICCNQMSFRLMSAQWTSDNVPEISVCWTKDCFEPIFPLIQFHSPFCNVNNMCHYLVESWVWLCKAATQIDFLETHRSF